MEVRGRRIKDKAFSGLGGASMVLLACSLVIILAPIFIRGCGAYVFRATVEHRKIMLDEFGKGDAKALKKEIEKTDRARKPVFDAIGTFESYIENIKDADVEKLDLMRQEFDGFKRDLARLLGPMPGSERPLTAHMRYGATRWDQVEERLKYVLNYVSWEDPDGDGECEKFLHPRREIFEDTPLAPAFICLEKDAEKMLNPRLTFYTGFITEASIDAHHFGGIWPELLGTIYLTIGAMIFAIPFGVIAAVYLAEYARDTWLIALIRTCISTLAGVPSIVFGLFGLAFLINYLEISEGKSVLAGAIVLALLVLPTIIRASEEAVRAVPQTYKEAALSLGSSRWRTIVKVILPSSLPGILTGIIISMGRAAGETAPIIFTAAVSTGGAIALGHVFTDATPALPWNIYNLCSENRDVADIRHVQYGMVMTLVMLVVLLNATAIFLRARISRKLRG